LEVFEKLLFYILGMKGDILKDTNKSQELREIEALWTILTYKEEEE
jgi:hypothetical protein